MTIQKFKNNKYTKWYNNIVIKAQNRIIDVNEYSEKHHIIPKSLGGNNKKENIVKLLPREHFIVHLLLVKMCINNIDKRNMSYALHLMFYGKNKKIKRYNSKLFEILKKESIKACSGKNNPFYGDHRFVGENNPFYGKKHSKETRKKISDFNKNKQLGENNPFYGKKHSKETIQLLSKQKSSSWKILFIDNTKIIVNGLNEFKIFYDKKFGSSDFSINNIRFLCANRHNEKYANRMYNWNIQQILKENEYEIKNN